MASRPQAQNRARPRRSETEAPPVSRPQLRVVRGKGGGAGKAARWSPIPIVVCVVLTVFGVTALQATMGQNGLKAAKLEKQVQEEQERNTLLRARVAQLSNPGRVADEAAKLGLVGHGDVEHVKVPTDHPEAFRSDLRPPADVKGFDTPESAP
jgi:cell division protein FtsL